MTTREKCKGILRIIIRIHVDERGVGPYVVLTKFRYLHSDDGIKIIYNL